MKDKMQVIVELALDHCDRFQSLVASGLTTWVELANPKPDALRSFGGRGGGYSIVVVQANTPEKGVVHMGMMTAPDGMVIKISDEHADALYHHAVAQRN